MFDILMHTFDTCMHEDSRLTSLSSAAKRDDRASVVLTKRRRRKHGAGEGIALGQHHLKEMQLALQRVDVTVGDWLQAFG